MSALTDKIRTRAHWQTWMRPATFEGSRVPYQQLARAIENAKVSLRGWPLPFVDRRIDFLRGADWVGQDIDAEVVSIYEAWRFWTSGQFSHLAAVGADWRGGAEATRVPQGFNGAIEVWEILFHLTEVFELAARLALGPAGDEEMVVGAHLEGIENRALVVGQRGRREFPNPFRSTLPSQEYELRLPRELLVADPRKPAAEMARDFFVRFGWEPSIQQLVDHQDELWD